MSRKGRNIYQRKCDKRWEGRVAAGKLPNGKTHYKYLYGKSYGEVREKMDRFVAELANRKSEKESAGKFDPVSHSWLESIHAEIKDSSFNKYRNILNSYIIPNLGEKDISDISNDDIEALIKKLRTSGRKDGKGLSSSTLVEILTILNRIRNYVIKKGYLVRYSTDDINIKRETKEPRVLSSREFQTLLNYLSDHISMTALGILLVLYTGIRLGELCALNYDDIDLTSKIIHIRNNVQRVQIPDSVNKKTELRITTPKTANSIREIPINDNLLRFLKHYYKPGAYLLTSDEHKYSDPRTIQNRFKKILAECGIKDAGFHSLRHSYATRTIEVGCDARALRDILGHSNVSITLNRYVHPTMERKAEYMNRLANIYAVRFVVRKTEERSKEEVSDVEFRRPAYSTQVAGFPVERKYIEEFINFICICKYNAWSVNMANQIQDREIFVWSDTEPDDCRKWCYAGGRRYIFVDCVIENNKGYSGWIYDIDLDSFEMSDYLFDKDDAEYINSQADDFDKAYAIAECINHQKETEIYTTEEELWQGLKNIAV